MADEVEKLLELAFKAEKFGDRGEAIRLYRQVANTDSDNANYASNCADELEKLGVAIPSTAPQISDVDADIANPSNPFQAPTTTEIPSIEVDAKYKIIWRNHFTSSIIWCLTVFCLLAAIQELLFLVTSLQATSDLTYPSFLMLHIVLFLKAMALLWVACFCGGYAKALRHLVPLTEAKLNSFTKVQFCLWIGVCLLAVLIFLETKMPQLMSYFIWYSISV